MHPQTGGERPVVWQHLTASLIRVAPLVRSALDGESIEIETMLLDEAVVVDEFDQVPSDEPKSPRNMPAFYHFG